MSSGPELPSGTVTFLFTDIEGSTRLLKQLRDGYAAVLGAHQELLRSVFAAHGGQVVDTQGDAFFVVFRRAKDAVEAATDGQRALQSHAWPAGVELRVRMGIHTGQAEASGGRYHGLAVHRASRIGDAAHGGQVLVSQTTRDLLDDEEEEAAGIELRDLGEQRLKDLDRPVRLHQLVVEGLASEFPPLRKVAPPITEEGATPSVPRRLRLRAAIPVAVVVIGGGVAAGVLLTRGSSGSAQASTGVAADSVGVFDARNGRQIAEAKVKTGPGAVAVGGGAIWVVNVDDESVSRIDPKTNAPVETIPAVGNGPSGIAVGGRFVWVANSLDGTVAKIDPRVDRVVDTIAVGNQPTGVAYGLGGVWVTNSADRTVVRIDPRSGAVGHPIPVDAGAYAIAVGDGAIWVTSGESSGSVARIDPRTGSEQTIDVGSGPSAVAIGAGAVWVANSLDDTVSRIDPASNKVNQTISVGAGPNGISVGRDVVWVSNGQGGTLSRIDPNGNRVEQTVETANRPQGVALSGDTLYVAVRTSGLAHRGGTLTVLSGSRFPYETTMDPAYICCDTEMLILTNDGLTGYRHVSGGNGTRLVPDLATSLPTPTDGGKTYTFQLRAGIRYSTGALVRPADFRRAIERSLANPSGYGPTFLSGIVGARACTKKRCDLSQGIVADNATNTVTFRLSVADPDMLYKLALPITFAVPASTPLKEQLLPLPATGPYLLARYDAKHGARLVRNPHFHEWSQAVQPNGYPDAIVWTFDDSPRAGTEQVRAVERGRADFAFDGVPATLLSEVTTQFAAQTHIYPFFSTSYVPLNTRLPPFNNRQVRQAVNYAFDRTRLAASQTPHGRPTCQVLPPGLFGYSRYCPYTTHPRQDGEYTGPDLAKAKQLVDASGTKGEPVAVWISNDARHIYLGRYLVSVLQSLGYRARLKVLKDQAAVFGALDDPQRKIQATIGIGWAADFVSPSDFFRPLFACGSNGNYARFCDRRIDSEIVRASSLQANGDQQAAARLWNTIDRQVVDQAPWVAWNNSRGIDFVSRRVGNYTYNPQWGALLDQLWVR